MIISIFPDELLKDEKMWQQASVKCWFATCVHLSTNDLNWLIKAKLWNNISRLKVSYFSMQNKEASLTRGGQLPVDGWPMWLWCGCPWCTWWLWWFWLCCEWVWWLSGLVLCPWPKGDIIFFWPGMLLACIRAMLDSTASQPSNPAWQYKQNVVLKKRRLQDSSRSEASEGRRGGLNNGSNGYMHTIKPWSWSWDEETSTDPFHMVSNRIAGMVCHRRALNACVFVGTEGLHSGWGVTDETTPSKIIRGKSLKIKAYAYMTKNVCAALICAVYQTGKHQLLGTWLTENTTIKGKMRKMMEMRKKLVMHNASV